MNLADEEIEVENEVQEVVVVENGEKDVDVVENAVQEVDVVETEPHAPKSTVAFAGAATGLSHPPHRHSVDVAEDVVETQPEVEIVDIDESEFVSEAEAKKSVSIAVYHKDEVSEEYSEENMEEDEGKNTQGHIIDSMNTTFDEPNKDIKVISIGKSNNEEIHENKNIKVIDIQEKLPPRRTLADRKKLVKERIKQRGFPEFLPKDSFF